jgi:hypothetical protein
LSFAIYFSAKCFFIKRNYATLAPDDAQARWILLFVDKLPKSGNLTLSMAATDRRRQWIDGAGQVFSGKFGKRKIGRINDHSRKIKNGGQILVVLGAPPAQGHRQVFHGILAPGMFI